MVASDGGNSVIQVDPQWTLPLKKYSLHVLVEDVLDLSMELGPFITSYIWDPRYITLLESVCSPSHPYGVNTCPTDVWDARVRFSLGPRLLETEVP